MKIKQYLRILIHGGIMIRLKISSVGLAILMSIFSFKTIAHESNPMSEFRMPSTMIAKIKFSNYKLEMQKLNSLHLDIAGRDIRNSSAEVVVNSEEFKQLEKLGFNISNIMPISLMRKPDARYKNPEDIERLLKDFNNHYPEITQLKEVGKSLHGRSIWAIKITSDAQKTQSNKPAVLFNGMHHAREVMGPEVALDIIETLLTGYGKDAKINHWIDSTEIWVLPMFNVDGNNIVWTNDSMWRKNARENYGVDINRNYPFAWGSCFGSSNYKGAQDYRGASAGSEPETKVMMNLVKEIRPVFDISYHSYSELVIYPLGCFGKRTQNSDVVESIGKEIGKKLDYTAGTAWETLYSVDGGDIDWMYSEYQVIPYVIEVNSARDGFQPDYSKRDPTVKLNRAGWQTLLERLDGPGVRGTVTSYKQSMGEYNIKIQKKNGEKISDYMNYRGNPNGQYNLILNSGEYRLTVTGSAMETSIKDIVIQNSRIEINL